MALPTDRVQVLKVESTALGGDSADEQPWPSPIQAWEDALEARGVYFQDAGSDSTGFDENVLAWRSGSDLYFKDVNQSDVSLSTLADKYTQSEVDTLFTNAGFGSGATNRVAFWSDTDTLTSSPNLTFDGSALYVDNSSSASIYVRPATTGSAVIQLGEGRSDSGYAYIDFVGDSTYTDYGLRVIRNNTGENASSEIVHRGTGDFSFLAREAADILLRTNNATRIRISSGGDTRVYNGLNVGSNEDPDSGTLTLDDASNGIVLYQTADRTTNYNRLVIEDTGSFYDIKNEIGGTETAQNIRIIAGDGTSGFSVTTDAVSQFMGASSSIHTIRNNANNYGLALQGRLQAATDRPIFRIYNDPTSGTGLSAASGTQYGMEIELDVNQSSTAGYTGLFFDVTETSTGSGNALFMHAQVGGVDRFRVFNSGSTFVGNTNVVSTSSPTYLSIGGTYGNAAGTYHKLYLFQGAGIYMGFGVSLNQMEYIVSNNSTRHVWYGALANKLMTLQSQTVGGQLQLENWLEVAEQTTPSTTSGYGQFYCKTDGKPYFQNDGGTEYDLAANTSLSGSGAANRVAFWSAANQLSSDQYFTWDGADLTAMNGSWATAGGLLLGSTLVTSSITRRASSRVIDYVSGVDSSSTTGHAFYIGGTQAVFIDQDRLVGIGKTPGNKLDVDGMIRTTGTGAASSGKGIEMEYSSGVGYIQVYDRGSPSYAPLALNGSSLSLNSNTDGIIYASSTICRGVNDAVLSLNGGNAQNAGANIELYGGTHATYANQAYYDAVDHNFRRQDGASTYLTMSNGSVTVRRTLNVYNSGASIVNIYSSTGGETSAIEIGSGGSSNRYAYIDFVGDDTYSDYGLRIIRGNTGANASTSFLHRGTGNLNLWCQEAASIGFWTSDTQNMTLDANGDFGIGTAPSSAGLHLYRSISGNTTFRVQNAGSGNAVIRYTVATGSSDWSVGLNGADQLFWYNTASAAGRMTLEASGKLNIDATTVSAEFTTTSTNAAADFKIIDADASNTRAALQIQGNSGATECLFVGSGGYVAVGRTNPESRLHVDETATLGSTVNDVVLQRTFHGHAGNSIYNRVWLRRDAAGSDWNTVRTHDAICVDTSFDTPGTNTRCWIERDPYTQEIMWGSSATEWMRINGTGLGIGTNGSPSYNLHIKSTAATAVFLEADTDNSGSADTPFVKFSTNGANTRGVLGFVGATNNSPEYGNTFTGAINNSLLLGMDTSGAIQFGTSAVVGMTLEGGPKLGLGTTTIPHGSVGAAMFAIDGTVSSADGPHVQYTVSTDNYPVFQQLNYSHDNISLLFDAYWESSTWKSSDAGSNFQITKVSDSLRFNYESGIAQGSGVTWNVGLALDNGGRVSIGNTPLVSTWEYLQLRKSGTSAAVRVEAGSTSTYSARVTFYNSTTSRGWVGWNGYYVQLQNGNTTANDGINLDGSNFVGMNVAPASNYRLQVVMDSSDTGADHTTIYGYRTGSATVANGGTGWTRTTIDSAVKGWTGYGNHYTAGVAGFTTPTAGTNGTCGVIGYLNSSTYARLGFYDGSYYGAWVAGQFVNTSSINGFVADIRNTYNNTNGVGIRVSSGPNSTTSSNTFISCYTANSSTFLGGLAYIYPAGCLLLQPSDENLKTNIMPTQVNGLSVVGKLEMIEYRRKDQDNTSIVPIGFLAQNCERAYPAMVAEVGPQGEEKPSKSVAPGALIPVLVKAIQEQQDLIKDLTSRIEALEAA